MRAFGAELVEAGHDFDAARETALRLAEDAAWSWCPPSIATWCEAWRPMRSNCFVPRRRRHGLCADRTGFGHRGVIAMRDALSPLTKVVGVVSTEAPAYALSFAAGKVVPTNSADTMADGMAVRGPDAEALAVILKGADRIVKVSDAEIAAAMRAYYEDTHQLTEGAGAARWRP
jgi:threonine dehydratase